MLRNRTIGWIALFVSATLLPRGSFAQSGRQGTYLQREVGHELRMLPYYSVFDDLRYRIDGYHVTLEGAVVRPTLKSDAQRAVEHIEGVEGVTNNIKILPALPNDDRIRMAEYRAIYGQSALTQYGFQAVPPIHIIVDNGHVTLEGVVANPTDKNIANVQANQVPSVFSVTNNLQVEPMVN